MSDYMYNDCIDAGDGTCKVHGGPLGHLFQSCPTMEVLNLVRDERIEQVARYGSNADLEWGTGPRTEWLAPVAAYGAADIEELFREDYIKHEQRTGRPTWMHLVREELAEAFLEDDPGRLEEELVQVAALCVSWIEKIRAGR